MARKRKRTLGGSEAAHSAGAAKARDGAETAAAILTNKVRHGHCKTAITTYATMMRNWGAWQAHVEGTKLASAGRPPSSVGTAAKEFHALCVRDPMSLGSRTGRKRRR